MRNFNKSRRNNRLYVRLTSNDAGAVVNGERRPIFKNPITGDGSKKSAKGLMRVELDEENGKLYLMDEQSERGEQGGWLQTVYEDGKLLN